MRSASYQPCLLRLLFSITLCFYISFLFSSYFFLSSHFFTFSFLGDPRPIRKTKHPPNPPINFWLIISSFFYKHIIIYILIFYYNFCFFHHSLNYSLFLFSSITRLLYYIFYLLSLYLDTIHLPRYIILKILFFIFFFIFYHRSASY